MKTKGIFKRDTDIVKKKSAFCGTKGGTIGIRIQ